MKSTVTNKSNWFLYSLLLLLTVTPYFRGLFFEQNFINVKILISILGVCFVIWLLISKYYNELHWTHYTIWLIPSIYYISYINSVSPLLAKQKVFTFIAVATLYMISVLVINNNYSRRLLNIFILVTGSWISVYGFFNAFGIVSFKDALLGDRMASVFQYPNTYAAYLLVYVVMAIFFSIIEKSEWLILSNISIYLGLISLILTYSRGVWLLGLLVFVMLMFFMTLKEQSLYMLKMVVSSIIVGLSLPVVINAISTTSKIGLVVIIIGCLMNAVLLWLIDKYVSEKFTSIKKEMLWHRILLPILLIIMGLAVIYLIINNQSVQNMLPSPIKERINAINAQQHSVLERQTFNKDAVKIVQDYPYFGTGGDGWRAIYQKYQNNPYISSQSHNFYSQLLVEIGYIGTGIFVLVMFIVIYRFFSKINKIQGRENKIVLWTYFISIFIILGHSLIDFNMSYGYINMLVFVFLGTISSIDVDHEHRNFIKHTPYKSKDKNKLGKVLIYCILSVLLFSLINQYRFILAEDQFKKGILFVQNAKVPEGSELLKKSLNNNPLKVEYKQTYAEFIGRIGWETNNQNAIQDSLKLYEEILDLEPFNHRLYEQASMYYWELGLYTESVELLERSLYNAIWDQEKYKMFFEKVNVYTDIMLQKNDSSDLEIIKTKAQIAEDLYSSISTMINKLKTLPEGQNQGRAFAYTPDMHLNMGKIYYRTGQFDEAVNVLNNVKSQDVNFIKEVYWYKIASLIKLDRNEIAEQLISEAINNEIPITNQEIEAVLSFPVIK
jgi:O-antigen ligase/tetratricopeptide (TPR) repeat protein